MSVNTASVYLFDPEVVHSVQNDGVVAGEDQRVVVVLTEGVKGVKGVKGVRGCLDKDWLLK